MGVTYKLKKEVVDYILLQKRTNPRLSCRKISNLASQFFQREISKSSVNTILKTFLLSSPVGRRSNTETKQEKFKIPDHRKKELFANAPKDALGLEDQSSEQLEVSLLEKEIITVSFESILLKAAESQIKKNGIMSMFFDGKTKLLDSLKYAPVFQLAEASDIFKNKAFLAFNNMEPKTSLQEIQGSINRIEEIKVKNRAIKINGFDLFSEAKRFDFLLKNGEEFTVDCQLNSVWTKDNVHSSFSMPIDLSLDFLSRNLVTNIEPLILRCAPGVESFPSYFYAMLGCFEGFEQKAIEHIDLVSQKNEILSSFGALLLKKRRFVSGLLNTHALFSEALTKKGPTLDVYIEAVDQNLLYSEADLVVVHPFLGKSLNVRVLILKMEGHQPFGLMTNISKSTQDAVQVINLYLKKWSYGVVGCQDFAMIKEEPVIEEEISSFSVDEKVEPEANLLFFKKDNVFIHNLLISLYRYCQKHFLPLRLQSYSWAKIRGLFSDVKVQIDSQDCRLKAVIAMSKNHAHSKDIEYIVRRINECELCFFDKKRIFLSFS